MNSRRNTQAGFALLEVLIAFAIAAMALGLLFKAAGSGGGAARNAAYEEEALSRARSRMAMLGRDAPLKEGERGGEDGGPYRWHVTVTPSATAVPPRDAPPTPIRLTLYDVQIVVSWTIDGRKHEVALHTRRLGLREGAANG